MIRLPPALPVLALLALAACDQKPKSPLPDDISQSLQPAFVTVFGQDAPVEAVVNREGKTISLPFRPALIADLGGGRVALVSRGETQEGCQHCDWSISVAYLKAGADNHFTVERQWFDLVKAANPLDEPPHIRIRKDLFDHPALEAESDRRDRGCEMTQAAFWELTPEGPVLRARDINTRRNNIPMGAMRTGPLQDYNAQIVSVKKGQSLKATYQGSVAGEVVWAPGPGGTWQAQPGAFKPPEC